MAFVNEDTVMTWIISLVAALSFVTESEGVRITYPPSNVYRARVGEPVVLRCADLEPDSLQWLKDGVPLTGDGRLYINSPDDRTKEVVIDEARQADAGLYTCKSSVDPIFSAADTRLIVTQPGEDWEGMSSSQVRITEPERRQLNVESGETFTMRCEGGADTRLVWHFNGRPLVRGIRTLFTQAISGDVRHSIMSRRRADKAQEGRYACLDERDPSNRAGVDVNIIQIETERTPVEIVEPTGTQHRVTDGHSFEIKCKADRNAELRWYKDDIVMENYRNGVHISESTDTDSHVRTSLFTKESATTEDSGTYWCVNAADETDSAAMIVSVVHDERTLSGNSIPVERSMVVMRVGSTVNLECSLEAPGSYTPEWSKDNHVLCPSPKYSILEDTRPSSLVISNTEREDAGMYKCVFKQRQTGHEAGVIVFNVTTQTCPILWPPDFGSFDACPDRAVHGESCSFICHSGYKLNIKKSLVCEHLNGITYWRGTRPRCKRIPRHELEANMPTSLSHVLLSVGTSLSLQCGEPASWSKNGNVISNDDKFLIGNGYLVIKNTTQRDTGVYDCYLRDTNEGVFKGIKKFNVTTLLCPPLYRPRNGSISGCERQAAYGETCHFRCDGGLRLSGSQSRKCVLGGHMGHGTGLYWTGERPTCRGAGSWLPYFANRGSSISSPGSPWTWALLLASTILLLRH